MKKQKTKLILSALAILFSGIIFSGHASANGSATISWVAPTTDVGGGALGGGTSDLAGYRVYYKQDATFDCAAWNAADQATRKDDAGTLLPSTSYNISNPATLKFACTNSAVIIPGHTYYFGVVAYDNSGNLSDCAVGSGTLSASKAVSYPADINTTGPSQHKVDLFDYNLFFPNFGSTTPGNVADLDANNVVNLFDYNILFTDFGKSF